MWNPSQFEDEDIPKDVLYNKHPNMNKVYYPDGVEIGKLYEHIMNKDTNIGKKQTKRKKMKTKPGTSSPSGNGVGKGGAKQSPVDGKSLNVKKKGGYKKGGSTKKG